MSKINVLDFQVANLIAAGEVVDRPASVVKELLENAIDAGATEIECEIRRGGVSYIRVTDNGCGMAKEDAELCILRHATSKIKEAEDLDSILTLGFRGEALAAISSVSLLDITTMQKEAKEGTYIHCDYGRITEVTEGTYRKGTTVVVKELFANVPARRKFLKRDQSEGMAVVAVIEKIALSHPEISFRMISDGGVRMQTAGDKKLYNAIYALLGREFAGKLLQVKSKNEAVEVFGYIGRPDNVKANRNYQNFFINGRYVKSRTASAALEQAYTSFMESEKFPCCVLNIVIHPALVDVNVHPTKLEVKFSNEKTVFDAVYLAVRNALLSDTAKPEMKLEKQNILHSAIGTYNRFTPVYDRIEADDRKDQMKDRSTEGSVPASKPLEVPKVPFDDLPFIFEDIAKESDRSAKEEDTKEERRADREVKFSGDFPDLPVIQPPMLKKDLTGAIERSSRTSEEQDRGREYIPLPKEDSEAIRKPEMTPETEWEAGQKTEQEAREMEVPEATPMILSVTEEKSLDSVVLKELPCYKLLGVAFDTYVLVEMGNKLLMIDKHAAHERLLFEKMKRNMAKEQERFVQLLLVPEKVHVGTAEMSAVLDYEKELTDIGFLFRPDSMGDTVEITGVPGGIDKEQALFLFADSVERLSKGEGNPEVSRKIAFEAVLYNASCKAAMKGGRHDGEEHIEYLVKQLLSLPDILYCPHGRPVAFEIPKGSIEHRFKRS